MTSPDTLGPCSSPPEIRVRRTRDGEEIERLLSTDYFDEPIMSFPRHLRRNFARKWCAQRDDIYIIIADVGGKVGGFVFGHSMGDQLVSGFLRSHPLHLPALLRIYFRLRLKSRRFRSALTEPASIPRPVDDQIDALRVPQVRRPFQWTNSREHARIALLLVKGDHRGQGMAKRLLDCAATEMSRCNIRVVEAHIEANNISSLRAFIKSGYILTRMADQDFLAQRTLQHE